MTSVLIIDDEAPFRKYVGYFLVEHDYLVTEANDGHEGLRLMRASPTPLVVLLDYLMPDFNGFDVLRAVYADPGLFRRHAVIILTAQSRIIPMELAAFMTRTDIPLLLKPFEFDVLLEVIREAEQRFLEDG
jgi:CheY-like chemotaxis protein